MPLFYFKCDSCGTQTRIFTVEEAATAVCKFCKGPVTRTVRPPSSDFKETVDNGIMNRRLEIYPDIKQLLDDRSKADDRNQRTKIFEEEDPNA